MKYPHGKISEDDEGELTIAIAADPEAKVVRINFRKPVIWIALEKEEATSFAKLILTKAESL